MDPDPNRRNNANGRPVPPPLDADAATNEPKLASQPSPWQIDDPAWAPVGKQYLLPVTIKSLQENKAEVRLGTGDLLWIDSTQLRPLHLRSGDRVAARSRFRPGHQLGTVRDKDGDDYLIQFDHGEQEWIDIFDILRPNDRPILPQAPQPSWFRWIFWLLLILGVTLFRNFFWR